MQTKIDICNAALILIGAEAISSFDENSKQSAICSLLYDNVYKNNLQGNLWRFSLRRSHKLNKVDDNINISYNSNIYKNAYQLPPDFLRLAGLENTNLPYMVFGTNILCNLEEMQIIYQSVVDEIHLPEYFKKIMVLDLCALLAGSMLESDEKTNFYENLKDKQTARARMIDSQTQSSLAIPAQEFSIIAVRT